MRTYRMILTALGLWALAGMPAAMAAPDVTGMWLTEKRKVAVELFLCGPELCGRIAWLAKPRDASGAMKRDTENPNPSLRDRPWCGMTVITGLERAGPGAWVDGSFYYPKHGRDYGLKLKQVGDGLKVRAYAGVGLIGKTEHWTRADPGLRCGEG